MLFPSRRVRGADAAKQDPRAVNVRTARHRHGSAIEILESRKLFSSYVTADYFPLAPGASRSYSGTYNDSGGLQGSATDLKTSAADAIGGTSVTRIDDTVSVGASGSGSESRYYAYGSGGLEFYGQSTPQATVTFSHPLLLMHTISHDGDVISWSNVGLKANASGAGTSASGTGTDSGSSTVIGEENVATVNGQTITAVEVVLDHTESYSLSISGQTASEKAHIIEKFWLLAGFGIVQFSGNVSLTASDSAGDQASETLAESFTSNSVPASLKIHVTNVAANVLSGDVTPSSGLAPLKTTATVTDPLHLWLGLSAVDLGSATSKLASAAVNPDNIFASLGVIPPGDTATYEATFTAPGDEVSVQASMTITAAVLNILDVVLPLVNLKAPSDFVDELDKLYKGSPLEQAVIGFDQAVATGQGIIPAATGIADALAGIVADPKEFKQFKLALKAIGITLTKAEIKRMKSVAIVIPLAEKLIDVAKVDVAEAIHGTINVDFTAHAG
jgi:hypothetical protein